MPSTTTGMESSFHFLILAGSDGKQNWTDPSGGWVRRNAELDGSIWRLGQTESRVGRIHLEAGSDGKQSWTDPSGGWASLGAQVNFFLKAFMCIYNSCSQSSRTYREREGKSRRAD
ncbi:hypothetical protein BsWGS_26120 [Bradybaena similaris]